MSETEINLLVWIGSSAGGLLLTAALLGVSLGDWRSLTARAHSRSIVLIALRTMLLDGLLALFFALALLLGLLGAGGVGGAWIVRGLVASNLLIGVLALALWWTRKLIRDAANSELDHMGWEEEEKPDA